jgi:uncharacterized protein YlxW (UPF0749 family)
MNAALRKYDLTEGSHMPANEKVDLDLAVQVAELRADVRHVQSDTTDIKAELRVTNQRLDSLSQKTDERLEQIKDSLASAKVWALGLYSTLAGSLLYVLARGFRWF